MKKTSRSQHGTLNELNITPLLDLAFVLLVIFIITTPQMVNHLEMTLPSGQQPTPPPDAPRPEIHRILINSEGATFLDGRAIPLPSLESTLASWKRAQPDLALVVNGADDADYQHMIHVLDLLRRLDIERVGLATEAVPGP